LEKSSRLLFRRTHRGACGIVLRVTAVWPSVNRQVMPKLGEAEGSVRSLSRIA
jgi:hypothetical protein